MGTPMEIRRGLTREILFASGDSFFPYGADLVEMAGAGTLSSGELDVKFPATFGGSPIVTTQVYGIGSGGIIGLTNLVPSGFSVSGTYGGGSDTFLWRAIGPRPTTL